MTGAAGGERGGGGAAEQAGLRGVSGGGGGAVPEREVELVELSERAAAWVRGGSLGVAVHARGVGVRAAADPAAGGRERVRRGAAGHGGDRGAGGGRAVRHADLRPVGAAGGVARVQLGGLDRRDGDRAAVVRGAAVEARSVQGAAGERGVGAAGAGAAAVVERGDGGGGGRGAAERVHADVHVGGARLRARAGRRERRDADGGRVPGAVAQAAEGVRGRRARAEPAAAHADLVLPESVVPHAGEAGDDERKLQRIDELEVGALRPEFVAGVENLRDALFAPETLKPKTICAGGAPIRGAAYVELVRQYVDAINSGGVPVISSAWDHVSRVECRHAAEDALALYLDHLAAHRHQVNTQHAPVEADALDLAASRAARLALEAFDRRAVGDFGHEARADLETKLHAKTADLLKANLRASDRFCEDLANKLYVDVVWADLSALSNAPDPRAAMASRPGESPADLAAGLAASWAELRRRYAARAKGPAKDAALLRFSAEKWPESTHELVRRIEARHDHEAQQEHDRLVKLKGELAEVEGSKEARAKILDDAQQSLVQTQMEKARAEARNAAVAKQLDQAREKERQTRAHLEAKLGDLELEIQRLHNQLAQQQASASRLDDRDAGTADVVGGKGGCKCSVS
eukprot:CAMPEP_0197411904 /NCGR_PEP_ID=MMETSP1165-20131217/32198_1 /TAXON_ID=284809 /ORGANISM="Chrysocystis fragilis, Strain CCMP3189" /LENGTH=635 /DNA_ID=CAMNT_0042938425 /DNA_START=93 /DNA_END=2003 /DNA_ORIENTATION=-